MQTNLTSGAPHERTQRLYVWGLSRSKRKRRNGLDLRAARPPVTPAQARPAVGSALRGHDQKVGGGGQKRRWPPWLVMGCGVVCALGGVDAGEELQLTRHGSLSGRECCGAGVHRTSGRHQPSDAGPFQHCPGLCGPRQGRHRRDQRIDSQHRQGLWLRRCWDPVIRYYSAGVAHWLSQRTEYLAGCSAALWSCLVEAQNAWGMGGGGGARTGAADPQIGQRTPSLCQGQGRQAPGADAPLEGGGAVARANSPPGGAAGAEPRSGDPKRHSDAWSHARGRQAAHPADRPVDDYGGGGQGQNRACGVDAGTRHRAPQGGEDGRVWHTVAAQSPWGWVYLWDIDLRECRRVEDARASVSDLPRDLWASGHPQVVRLRSGGVCHGNAEGAGPRGGQGDWYSTQGQGSLVCCRGRPRDGQKRTRQDRRDHWHPEDGQVQIQQAQRTSLADAGDGRPSLYPLVQSEQADAGSGPGRQVKIKVIRSERTIKTALVERQGGAKRHPITLKGVLRHALPITYAGDGALRNSYGLRATC